MAIDYGKKRTGLAVTDVLQIIANGLTTVPTQIPIEYVDERFTSVLAHQAMIDGGLKKKDRQRKELVDEISATIILQSYMDSRKLRNL